MLKTRPEYFHVAEWRILEWEASYFPLNVRQEITKMYEWLEANPRRRKKNYARFAINWLGKAHAQVVVAQAQARSYARVGEVRREAVDYSEEVADVLERHPDLKY